MTQTNRFPEVEGENLERRPFVLPRDIEREFGNAALWAFGRRTRYRRGARGRVG